MMRTASRTTASLSEEKKRKTWLRCQLGREVGEALAIAMDGHFPREVRDVQRESLKGSDAALRRPPTAIGARELTSLSLFHRAAESLQMRGESGRIEGVERFYIGEKLIELRIDFPWTATIWIERVGQPVEREDEPFRALGEQRVRRSLRSELLIRRCEPAEQRARGALAPIRHSRPPRKRI